MAQLEQTVMEHEKRLRKLEESDIKQQLKLSNIEKSQSDIKLMINETSKEQQKAYKEVTNKLIDTLTDREKTNNKNSIYNTKQFWAGVGAIIGILANVALHFSQINKRG